MLLERETPTAHAVPGLPGRLPFVLPDFARVQWASAPAKAVWQPRVSRVANMWNDLERWSVVDGARAGALQVVSPAQMPALAAFAAQHGCVVLPLAQQGAGGSYSSTTPAMTAGAWAYRVAFVPCDSDVIAAWFEAWGTSDDTMIGQLLGFPACCQGFFDAVWIKARGVDTTWQQAVADNVVADAITLTGTPTATNLLWRWLGVRMVPHLPCSHTCEASRGVAENIAASAKARGFAEEWAWAEEMLSWPVQWTARHGIAIIETPILTMSARTDATAGTLSVQRHGTRYPLEGAQGTRFPYRVSETIIPLTSLRKFRDAFEPKASDAVALEAPALNGFSSSVVQTAAHDLIAGLVDVEGRPLHVLDLGCGDGTLARRLATPGGFAAGIEIDPARALAARTRLDVVADGSFLDADWPTPPTGLYDLVLLMPGRLIETPAPLLARLSRSRVILYAYGDWLGKYGNLESITVKAGLPWKPIRSRRITEPMRVEAALMEF